MSCGRIVAFLALWYAVNTRAALRTTFTIGSAGTARIYQTGGLAETGKYIVNLLAAQDYV